MLTPTQPQDVSRTGKSMAITNFEFPGVSLEQVFQEQAAGAAGTMDVVCVGQQYALHRANVTSEAVLVPQSTPYDKTSGLTVALPGRNPAYTLDTDSKTQRLVVKNGQYEYTTLASTAVDDDTRKITFASPVKDGNGHTAAAGFGTRGAKIGDTVQLVGTVSDATVTVTTEILGIYNVEGVGYAQIMVADIGTFTSETDVTVHFCAEIEEVVYPEGDAFTINSAESLIIQGGLEAPIPELSGSEGTLILGDFYIEFRELANDFVGKLGSVASLAEVEDALGGITAENPLAVAVAFAISAAEGGVVNFTGVRSDEAAGYTEALDFLEKFDNLYGVVPATEDANILQACITMVLSASEDPDSKIRRTLWYGITNDEELDLYTGTANFAYVASPESRTITFSEDVFLDHPFAVGDYIEYVATGERFKILSTDQVKVATVEGTRTAAVTAGEFTLIRTVPTNYELVENAIAKRVVSSYRAQGIWADQISYNGELVGNYAGAAAAAGMRSAEPVHRPLSNLGYTFFSVVEPHGFTKSQLKQIGANGIWIIANNTDGVPTNLRQVTTAVANSLNLDEESIVSNADEVALELCRVGEDLVGCSNISPTLITVLSDTIRAIMEQKLSNTEYSVYVGPQLESWSLDNIYQDPVNLDRVYASITCTPPRPFNQFKMTLRVI